MMLPRLVVMMPLSLVLLVLCAGCNNGLEQDLTAPRASLQLGSSSDFVTTGGAEISIVVDDFTQRWSFVAKRNDDLTAQGQFQVVAKVFGNTSNMHGEIRCFMVDGNRARLGGVVTHPPELDGFEIVWSVEDNGEGANAPAPDRVSALEPGDPEAYCLLAPVPAPETLPIETGNVQVHN
jgi:hypothetical protein